MFSLVRWENLWENPWEKDGKLGSNSTTALALTLALVLFGLAYTVIAGFDVKDEDEGGGEGEKRVCGSECDVLDDASHVAVVGDMGR